MTDDQTRPGGNNLAQFPPLQISDLIVLTLSVALTMASITPGYREALGRNEITAWDVARDLPGYLAIGICLFGWIVLARQRWRRNAFPLSPGQWILIVIGPYSVVALIALWIRQIVWGFVPGIWNTFAAIDDAMLVLVIGSSMAISLFALRGLRWDWRLCLLLILAWLSPMVLWFAFDGAANVGYPVLKSPWREHVIAVASTFEILAGVVALIALLVDTLQGARRDWLHYFGVAALILGGIEVPFTWGELVVRFWRDLYYHLLP